MKRPNEDSDRAEGLQLGQLGFGLALNLALELGICIVLGVWADRKYGTAPFLTLAGVLVGLMMAGATLFAMTRIMSRRSRKPPE